MSKLTYVGNCITSFDEDGDCINSELPFTDVSDFAYQLEKSKQLTPDMFFEQVEDNTFDFDCKLEFSVLEDMSVFIAYNDETDIHFFFA